MDGLLMGTRVCGITDAALCGVKEWETGMTVSEREKLSSFLFGRDDKEVCNIKFMRGESSSLTAEQLCEAARNVIEAFWDMPGAAQSALPCNSVVPRRRQDILASY